MILGTNANVEVYNTPDLVIKLINRQLNFHSFFLKVLIYVILPVIVRENKSHKLYSKVFVVSEA